MKEPNGLDLLQLLVELYAQQEHVHIQCEFYLKEGANT
jgi:hypothetical protein